MPEIRSRPKCVKQSGNAKGRSGRGRSADDGLERNNFAERKLRIGLAAAPIMMPLGREEKCFHVAPEALDQFGQGLSVGLAGQLLLLIENVLGLDKVVRVTGPLENEIETMNREAAGREKLRHGFEAGAERIRGKVFQDRNGKDGVE